MRTIHQGRKIVAKVVIVVKEEKEGFFFYKELEVGKTTAISFQVKVTDYAKWTDYKEYHWLTSNQVDAMSG